MGGEKTIAHIALMVQTNAHTFTHRMAHKFCLNSTHAYAWCSLTHACTQKASCTPPSCLHLSSQWLLSVILKEMTVLRTSSGKWWVSPSLTQAGTPTKKLIRITGICPEKPSSISHSISFCFLLFFFSSSAQTARATQRGINIQRGRYRE